MKLHIFNPENDLALADGNSNYCPPPMARTIAHDLAALPLWYAANEDMVMVPSLLYVKYATCLSALFTMPSVSLAPPMSQITAVAPWGWSAQMRRRLKDMGVGEPLLPTLQNLEHIRALSNRRVAINIMQALRSSGIDTPDIPIYTTQPAEVAAFINSIPRSVIKAPWSGSGKGIAWGIGRVEVPVEHFYMGVIKRQGGVVCERYLDKVIDFAMEFSVQGGVVSFAGYSLFTCEGGSYSGNILAADTVIEAFLCEYISRDVLGNVKRALISELSRLLAFIGYDGYLGVDMLIYCHNGTYRLNPCVELNLRMNMGAVSRLFYDKYVDDGAQGRFLVSFYKKKGDALAAHNDMQECYPLCVRQGRVLSGYMPLSPVTADSRYSAFVVIADGGKSLNELYFSK